MEKTQSTEGVERLDDRRLPIVQEGEAAVLDVDTSLYEVDAILRAAYKLTDRCYLFVTREGQAPGRVSLYVLKKTPASDLDAILGELCNELLDQQIRLSLAREAGPLRELIVAQAFAEGNLLDPQRDDGDYENDPLGLGRSR
jgi:His-Xaa-Ser system protein HxsD